MNKCVEIPHVKDSMGNVIESKLFTDLTKYAPNLKKAQEWHSLAVSEKFMRENESQLVLDQYGEPTFNSFRKASGLDIDNAKIIEQLNNEIGSGRYYYNAAVEKIQDFNNNSEYNEDFMATITYDKGKFNVEVVSRTDANEVRLHDQVERKEYHNNILNMLKSRGVNVEFIETDDREGGRYSTENVERLADGTYGLIKITRNKNTELADERAYINEEAGHVTVGILNDNPLVQRLLNLLKNETLVKSLLGDEFNKKALGLNPEREIAGTLIGKSYSEGVQYEGATGRLIQRIKDMARRIMSVFKNEGGLIRAQIEAKRLADQIAYGFYNNQLEGTAENALAYKETLYSANSPINVQKYREIVGRLNLLILKLNSIKRDKTSKMAQKILAEMEKGNTPIVNDANDITHANQAALDGITIALNLILDKLGPDREIDKLLKSFNPSDLSDYHKNRILYGQNIRKAREFYNAASTIANIVDTVLNAKEFVGDVHHVEFVNSFGISTVYDLSQITDDLKLALSQIKAEITTKERVLLMKFVGDTYGKRYARVAGSVVWTKTLKDKRGNIERDEKGRPKEGGWRNKFLKRENPYIIDFGNDMDIMETDIDVFEKYLSSMSNSRDSFGLIFDKATKLQNKIADDNTNQSRVFLSSLERKALALGYNSSRLAQLLYERYTSGEKAGQFTGNFISKLKWGEWEDARLKVMREARFEFQNGISEYELSRLPEDERARVLDQKRKERADHFSMLSSHEKAYEWLEFLGDIMKEWNEVHSFWDKKTKKWKPNSSSEKTKSGKNRVNYDNTDAFNALMSANRGLEDIYNSYMEHKEMLDSKLESGSTLTVRIPQFKGRFTQRVKNQTEGSKTQKVKRATRKMMSDAFLSTETDADEFGSELTYNSEEEFLLESAITKERESINRLPLYGINKLKDMSELSTDIFSSTLAYAGMANSYEAMSQIVDAMEIGMTVLGDRKVGGLLSEKERSGVGKGKKGRNISGTYVRLQKFVDKQLYGVGSTVHTIDVNEGRKFVLEKLIAKLTTFGSAYFLGGNIVGGLVNTGTGINEIFKEALTNQFFGLRDLAWAYKTYFASIPANLSPFKIVNGRFSFAEGNLGRTFKDDDISLLINRFNILSKNRQKYRDFMHDRSVGTRMYNAIANQSIWFAYSSGDHLMNTVPFLALMHRQLVYDANGKQLRASDIYTSDNSEKLNDIVEGVKTMGFKKYMAKILDEDGNPTDREEPSDQYFRTKEGAKTYRIINSIINKVESNVGLGMEPLTDAEKEYLADRRRRAVDAYNVRVEDTIDRQSTDYDLEKPKRLLRTLKQDAEELLWGQRAESDLMDKAREISIRMHGIYNSQDMVAFSQDWYGRMVLSMRGYALGMLQRRYGRHKYNLMLDTDMEGSWNTSIKALAMACSALFNIDPSELEGKSKSQQRLIKFKKRAEFIASILFPVGDWSTNLMLKQGFSRSQAYNLRRTAGDAMLATAFIITHALSGLGRPSSDDKRYDLFSSTAFLSALYYFSGRLGREQEAFSIFSPKTFYQEFDAITMIVPSSVVALWDLISTVFKAARTPLHSKEESDWYFAREKGNPNFRLHDKYESKAINHMLRMAPGYRSVYPAYNFYTAYDNYVWGVSKATNR